MNEIETFLSELKEETQSDSVTLLDADTKPYVVATWGNYAQTHLTTSACIKDEGLSLLPYLVDSFTKARLQQ